MEPVKAKRRYDSSRRRAQAEATRADILEAAQRRFERDGYAATSMEAVATEAGGALHAGRIVKERIGGVLEVIRGAAQVDPDVAALWSRIQSEFHDNQRVIVESLDRKGALGPDVDAATDVLWTINHPNVWQLLVGERDWTPDRWERWSADLACTQLLAP